MYFIKIFSIFAENKYLILRSMEKEVIIQQEVKNGLSEYGINEEERREYENLILGQIKDKEFEKEEDLTNDVKARVQSLVPSVKLLQRRSTKFGQEKAEVLRQFEEYKKNNPIKKEEPKKEPEQEDTPAWARALLNKVEDLEKERIAERKAKELDNKKTATLSALKPKYNKSFYATIDVLAQNIDWSKENAENEFKDLLSGLAKDNPVWLANAGEEHHKDKRNILMSFSSSQTDKEKQKEFNKKLV